MKDDLAAHVRPGDQPEWPWSGPSETSLGTKVPGGKRLIEHGMPAIVEFQDRLVGQLGPDVLPRRRQFGQGRQHVELARTSAVCSSRAVWPATRSRRAANRSYSSCMNRSSAAEDFFLVFLQLRRDVALGILERLLALVIGGNLAGVGVGDLDVVAEDLIEADLQTGDAGAANFVGLERAIQSLPPLAISCSSSSSAL